MKTYTGLTKIVGARGKAGHATGVLFNFIAAFLVKYKGDENALPPLFDAMGPDMTEATKKKLVKSLGAMAGTDWTDMGGRSTFSWVQNIGAEPALSVKAIVDLARAGTPAAEMVILLAKDSGTPSSDEFTKAKKVITGLPTKGNGKVYAARVADVQAMIDTLTAMLPESK